MGARCQVPGSRALTVFMYVWRGEREAYSVYCVMEISSVTYGEVRIKGEGNQYEMIIYEEGPY